VSEAVKSILADEGIALTFGARDFAVAKDGTDIRVSFSANGVAQAVTGSHLLVATGRRPNCDSLGLEAAGIGVDRRGYIVVNDKLETNVPGIYAMGDINGRGGFTTTNRIRSRARTARLRIFEV
jgi:pyruvate/2-oxoglutarate dehydrogenase complex dihydrolipoamide dehydrogenase (E3) component